jgi:galactokinase
VTWRRAIDGFVDRFGQQPDCVIESPGRINLIGEHTDYSGGLCMPMAIDRSTLVAVGSSDRPGISVHSMAFGETVLLSKCRLEAPATGAWFDYAVGAGAIAGFDPANDSGVNIWIGGNLPPGLGLGSSAALCVALLIAIARERGIHPGHDELLRQAQAVEHQHVGMPCGIMDQYACLHGRSGHAMLLDCRDSTHQWIPMMLDGVSWVLVDSGVRHELARSAYASRVWESREALKVLQAFDGSLVSLRNVLPSSLGERLSHLRGEQALRVRHIVTENQRVVELQQALVSGDASSGGNLLSASHASLRDDYEVSCDEVESLRNFVMEQHGVLGARMVGGGFGGSVLVLVASEAVDALVAGLSTFRPGLVSGDGVMPVRAADGVRSYEV